MWDSCELRLILCPQPSIEHFWATLAQTKLCEAVIHLRSKDKKLTSCQDSSETVLKGLSIQGWRNQNVEFCLCCILYKKQNDNHKLYVLNVFLTSWRSKSFIHLKLHLNRMLFFTHHSVHKCREQWLENLAQDLFFLFRFYGSTGKMIACQHKN